MYNNFRYNGGSSLENQKMAVPRDILLVRHGESEQNIAKKKSKKGDHSLFTKEFRGRHNSTFRLTDKGRKQADMAGDYIRAHLGDSFYRYYVSEYSRALETAALLKLPFAKWRMEFYLRERDWGKLDVVSEEDKSTTFKEAMDQRKRDGFFWRPPGGESMSAVCLRWDRFINTLARECDGEDKVIVVCHGEVMWAARVRMEKMSHRDYQALEASPRPQDKIHNCQILHYTRENPETKKLSKHFGWMMSICPTDLSRSSNVWVPIERKEYSNAEIQKIAEEYPRMIN